ncbi:related to ASG1 - activator of stress genes [Ustilago trichophora]|uniref:Related to ASG1 - activator of stress genes n=1 Tax=Ustilago trichophora TaxID=86804 RepID=A0A5C3EHB8_9BASI|nr:related to ASG1 - activator of stress genes [Ustilago trichophora]
MIAATTADKPRSMNRSCIQCRERKIKCDRLDPCSQCTAKGAADECKRELRKKRAKNKHPFPKRKSRTNPSPTTDNAATINFPQRSYNAQSGLDAAGSTLSWAERPMTTASHQSETSYTPSSSGKVVTPNTSSSVHDFAYCPAHVKDAAHAQTGQATYSNVTHEDDTDNLSSNDSTDSDSDDALEPDNRLHILEANQLVQLQTAPQHRCPFALKDVYAEWRTMSMEQRRALVQEIRDALPSPPQTLHLLHDVYVKRIHSIHGNIVHIPTVQVVLTELLTDPVFEQRDRYAFGHITTALLVIFAALRFAPLDRTYTWARRGSTSSLVEALGQKEIRQRQRKIYSLVKRIQRFESTFTFGSIPELQTAVLMLAAGKGTSSFLESLADCAIRSAMRMRIHRLGSLEKMHDPKAKPIQIITGEMAVRCWWALVRRDWSQSNKHRTYRISPAQFNTRQPLNLFDDELLIVPCPRSHLRSTWTYVSYSYATIDFAIMTRTLVDQVNAQSNLDEGPDSTHGWGLASVFGQRLSAPQRDSLDQMFQSVIAAFPAHYSLEARYDVVGLVDVERWLLHQRLFYLFLTLHMPLVSEAARPHGSLMYMASHILDIQDKVTDICTRLDNCYLTTLQTLRACLVLLLDLFFTEASVNISGLSRLMTRRKITAALDQIPMDVLSSTTKLCVQLVRILVTLEEQHHRSQVGSGASAVNASPVTTDAVHGAAVESVAVVDAAVLRNQWHATCQILDVLLNDGYWQSFRKNLLQLDHLIPDWLQKPVREDPSDWLRKPVRGGPSDNAAEAVVNEVPSQVALPSSTPRQPANMALPQASCSSRLERGFDAGAAEAVLGPIADVGLTFPFDPKLLEDLDVSGLDIAESSSQLPQFDMDLIGHQDFEGFGNSSQSIDFTKMLMDWRVDIPITS